MMRTLILALLGAFFVLITGTLIGACRVGAWNLIFPSSKHEHTPPPLPEDLASPAVLVFSKTNAFRHVEGIEGARILLDSLANVRQLGIFHTENSAVFNPESLARFSVVIFSNVTGDVMSEAQEQSFKAWLEAGGAWLGIHSAGDASHAGWPWYVDTLIGANFTAHIMGPQFQEATVHVEDTTHTATGRLPRSWEHEEEWYSWDESVRGKGFNVLVSVDETTYTPVYKFLGKRRDLRMGDHPVVWNRCVEAGRAFYSALGHSGEAFNNPPHRALLEGALDWLLEESACMSGE